MGRKMWRNSVLFLLFKLLFTSLLRDAQVVVANLVPSSKTPAELAHGSTFQIPIYYINMDKHVSRRTSIEAHLSALQVPYFQRIPAHTIDTCNLLMAESPCLRVNFLDVAIMCSHLQALYTALHDPHPIADQSEYFLVLEDDVRFLWTIDFDALIDQAPRDFGALQLMLSHRPQIEDTWERFIETEGNELFVYRPRNSSVWSAQAILYRKSSIRSFINAAVSKDRQGNLGFKMVNSFQYDKLIDKPAKQTTAAFQEKLNINPFRPVIACECLFADMFLYAMARPAYMTALPLMNSAAQGMKSTIHQDHVAFHIHGFLATETLFTKMNMHLQEELMSAIQEKALQVTSATEGKWKEIAQDIVNKVLPVVRHSNLGDHSVSQTKHENKARPSFLVHPLLPAQFIVEEIRNSNAQMTAEEQTKNKLILLVQEKLHLHLWHSVLPRNQEQIPSNHVELESHLYYNITQWHKAALANPVENWVFTRIYGDAKRDQVDSQLLVYLKEEKAPQRGSSKRPPHQRHFGPTTV